MSPGTIVNQREVLSVPVTEFSMSGQAQRNENGRRAEYRTEAFLLDNFWVFKFAVNLDGAVFLVQTPTRAVESFVTHSTARPVSLLLSVFCGADGIAEIPRLFVERPDRQPQKEVFVSIHAAERPGEPTDMFFSAEELQSVCRRVTNAAGQDLFVFAQTQERNFSQFQRRNGVKVDMISAALAGVDPVENLEFLKRVIKTIGTSSVHPPLVQVTENQWQMRYRESLFKFERCENSIIHGWKTDVAGTRQVSPLLPVSSLDDYEFDPLNEVWVLRPQ